MNMTTNMAQRRPTTAPPMTAATTFYINISIAVKFTLCSTNITGQRFSTVISLYLSDITHSLMHILSLSLLRPGKIKDK
jgi:hypothetical protein